MSREVACMGRESGEGLVNETWRSKGVIDEIEAVFCEIAQAAADAVAYHQRAGEDGGGDGHACDDGEVGGAEIRKIAEEEGEAGE